MSDAEQIRQDLGVIADKLNEVWRHLQQPLSYDGVIKALTGRVDKVIYGAAEGEILRASSIIQAGIEHANAAAENFCQAEMVVRNYRDRV